MSGVSPTKGSPKSTTKSGSERALDSGKSTDIPPNMSNNQTPSVPETMATDTKKVKNPYFLIILSEYMTIILSYDKDQSKHPATKLWQYWVANGI